MLQGFTPCDNRPFTAVIDADLSGVVITNYQHHQARYSWRDLISIVGFIERQAEPLPLWCASGEPNTLENYLKGQKLKAYSGCLADLLRQTGLASCTTTPSGHAAISKV